MARISYRTPGRRAGAISLLALASALSACQTSQSPGLSVGADPVSSGLKAAQARTTRSAAEDVFSGDRALASGDLHSARKSFSAAMRTNPSDPRPIIGMAETFLALGDLEKADQLLELVADASNASDHPRVLQGRGLIALRQGRTDEATNLLRRSVDGDPKLWRAWLGLGRTWIRNGDHAAARAAFARAELYGPDKAAINNDIGMARMAENAPLDAIQYFEKALQLNPAFDIARGNIRIARAMSGQYDIATAGARPEETADILNNTGYIAILNGDYDVADRLLRRALQVSPVYHVAAVANLDLLAQTRENPPQRSARQPVRSRRQPRPQAQPFKPQGLVQGGDARELRLARQAFDARAGQRPKATAVSTNDARAPLHSAGAPNTLAQQRSRPPVPANEAQPGAPASGEAVEQTATVYNWAKPADGAKPGNGEARRPVSVKDVAALVSRPSPSETVQAESSSPSYRWAQPAAPNDDAAVGQEAPVEPTTKTPPQIRYTWAHQTDAQPQEPNEAPSDAPVETAYTWVQ